MGRQYLIVNRESSTLDQQTFQRGSIQRKTVEELCRWATRRTRQSDCTLECLINSVRVSIERCSAERHFFFFLNDPTLYLPVDLLDFTITITYPLTAGVDVGTTDNFRTGFLIFLFLHCLLGLVELQACPVPHVVVPPLFLSALSSSPFHRALKDGFGQT